MPLTLGNLRLIRAVMGCTQLTATIAADGIDIFGCCLRNNVPELLVLMRELEFVQVPSQDEKLVWKPADGPRDSIATVRVSLRP